MIKPKKKKTRNRDRITKRGNTSLEALVSKVRLVILVSRVI